MKIKRVILTNFRAFKNVQSIEFDDFNCIIGKNDVGKSSILVALEWFFGNRELSDIDINIDNIEKEEGLIVSGDELSVEVFFEVQFETEVPNFYTDDSKYFYHKDFLEDNILRIKKYYLHSSSHQFDSEYNVKKTEYSVYSKHYNNLSNRPLSFLSTNEIKNEGLNIGKDFKIIKANFQKAIENQKQNSQNDFFVQELIHRAETVIDSYTLKSLCEELSARYGANTKWNYEPIESSTMDFILKSNGWFPKFRFFNAETPLKEYIKLMFSSPSTQKAQNEIDTLKNNVAQQISSKVFQNGQSENFSFSADYEYLANSMLLSGKGIPLSNRGDGFQLRIKNAVFRLLSEHDSLSIQPTVFVFEEPETHLHPSAQIEMYETIQKLSETKYYQVVITSHSPYIVNALSENKTEVIVVKRENDETTAKNVKLSSERILNYLSLSEISYIAFDVASIEYHQELYGKIEIDWEGESNGYKIDSIICYNKICQYQCDNRTKTFEELANDLVVMFAPKIKAINSLNLKNNSFVSPDQGLSSHSMCHCVRNSIDHPCKDNEQWKKDNVIDLSTKILVELNNCFLDIKQKFIKKIDGFSDSVLDTKWEKMKFFVDNGSSKEEQEHTLLYWLSYIYKDNKTAYKYDNKHNLYKPYYSYKKLLDSLDRSI